MRAKLCRIAYKLGLRRRAFRIDFQTAVYLKMSEVFASMAASAQKAVTALQAAAAAYQQQFGGVENEPKEEAQE